MLHRFNKNTKPHLSIQKWGSIHHMALPLFKVEAIILESFIFSHI